jgi:cytochrome c oxidase subunit 4
MEHGNQTNRSGGLRRGVIVLIALAVLTVIEYFVAVFELPVIVLILIALLKAAAVLWYFMHIAKVFGGGEEH